MTKPTATDRELSVLHKRVADVMLNSLEQQSTAQTLLRAVLLIDTSELPVDAQNTMHSVIDFLDKASDVNPALLQAVTKFLRDNNITAEVEETPELKRLEGILAQKKKRTLDNVVMFDDN